MYRVAMNEEPWNLKAIAVGALVFAAAEGAVLLFSGAFPNRFDPPRPGPGLITFFLAGAVAGMAGGFATALFTQRDALVHLVAASWMVFALIVFPLVCSTRLARPV